MNQLQLVVYPLSDVLLGWKQIGDILGEENPRLLPELFYEANESASERAEGGGRRTHVVVAPGIFGMRIGVAPILASPCPFIPISCTLLIQVVAGILHQEFLRGVGKGKDRNSFYSDQLLVEVFVHVSAT